jgi:hypothetical protein
MADKSKSQADGKSSEEIENLTDEIHARCARELVIDHAEPADEVLHFVVRVRSIWSSSVRRNPIDGWSSDRRQNGSFVRARMRYQLSRSGVHEEAGSCALYDSPALVGPLKSRMFRSPRQARTGTGQDWWGRRMPL